MQKCINRRIAIAIAGLVVGMAMTRVVVADVAGDDRQCAGDCQAAVASCCKAQYPNLADCRICCNNTFSAFPTTYCGRADNSVNQQCIALCR